MIIRSGALGAYVRKQGEEGFWVDAFWQKEDQGKIVDVTGIRLFYCNCNILHRITYRCRECFFGGLVSWLVVGW